MDEQTKMDWTILTKINLQKPQYVQYMYTQQNYSILIVREQ